MKIKLNVKDSVSVEKIKKLTEFLINLGIIDTIEVSK